MFDFSKKYSPESIQQEILSTQQRGKIYHTPEIKKNKEKNTVHLLRSPVRIETQTKIWEDFPDTLKQDTYKRYLTMTGKKVWYIPCFNYWTIQPNQKTYKQEQREQDLHKQKDKRMKEYIQAGCACDERLWTTTFWATYMRKVRNTIGQLVKEWYIQKQDMINYRSNKRQTHVSPEDILRKKTKWTIYNIRYFVDTKNITLIVSTASPENIFWDVALAVHPDDRRYKKLIGHKVIIPIVNKTIPIIWEETVDTTKNNGVMRVCPCHDTRSLEIAKKHKLETHNFAIDHNWCFTTLAGDFCGKTVKDFFENIIQNLDDIHNLQGTEDAEIILPIDKQSKETLEAVISEQRFFAYSQEENMVSEIMKEVNVSPENYKNIIETSMENWIKNSWAISKKDWLGIPFPAWKNEKWEIFFIIDTDIFTLPQKIRKNKKHILAMIIINMIQDGRLPIEFSIEELIELLFKNDDEDTMLFGEKYLMMIETQIPRGYASEVQELKKIFEYGQKDNSINHLEKCSAQLMNILEKSIAIIDQKWGEYYFNAKAFTKSDTQLQISTEKIDTTFSTARNILENTGIQKGMQAERTLIHIQEEDKNMLIKTLLLAKTIYWETPIQNIYIHTSQSIIDQDIYKEMIKKWGNDATRLCLIQEHLLSWEKWKWGEGEEYLWFINKTRNACRFILQHLKEQHKKLWQEKIDISILANTIEKKSKKGLNHEHRILNKIQEFYDDLPEILEKDKIQEFSLRLMEFIRNDFCEKYLEIMKIRSWEATKDIALFGVAILLKLLHPLLPFVTEKIRKLYNFKWDITTNTYIPKLTYIHKNYKTQIFMDIIDKLHHLREAIQKPKHEKIDICISASIDFQQYMKEHEDIIQKLLYTNEIQYIDNEKDLAKYEIDTIIDVTIGVRGIGKPIKQNNYIEREQEITRKQEKLQNIRKIAGQLSLQWGNKKAIEQKKEEMKQIKDEIERIEYEIKKIRMNEK